MNLSPLLPFNRAYWAAPDRLLAGCYPTYLLRLTERELIDRERRATERRIKEAAFPVLKTMETFDFAAQASINEPLVRELLRGEYIGKRENLLLVGNPGTSKTHLATPWVSPPVVRANACASPPRPDW